MFDIDRREGYYNEPIDPDGLVYAVRYAFSRNTRRVIKDRAGGRSELDGKISDRPHHCSHNDHSRYSGHYDKPENGTHVRDTQHAGQHILNRELPNYGGLTREQNEWSIGKLLTDIFRWDAQHDRDSSDSVDDIYESINLWRFFWDLVTNRVETTETHLQDRD